MMRIENNRRRKILKSVVTGSSIAAVVNSVPDNWVRPVVETVLIPAHAETTDNTAVEPEAPPQPTRQCCTISALIDGRSQLVVKGDVVYWQHLEHAPPGLHEEQNLPTTLCGNAWYPVWPGACDGGCTSQSVSGLVPEMIAASQTVNLSIVTARENVTILQQPDAGNDYTLIIDFNDSETGGSATYEIEICYLAEPG